MNIEKELLRACIRRERKAQFQLYRNCYSLLMSICIRYNNNREDAESILNQGFLKILNNLGKYRDNVPFGIWIRRIMINIIIDDYRQNKKRIGLIDYADMEGNTVVLPVDYNEAEKLFEAKELEELLSQLPSVSRQVFNLFAIDGYNHKEIGEMLGISEGTSKWHVSFARSKLKELMNKKITTIIKPAVSNG